MKTNFNLLFYIRKQKTTKAVPCLSTCVLPLMANVRICPQDVNANPLNGTTVQDVPLCTKEDAKSLNNYLDSLQSKVKDAHQALIDTNQTVTTESLLNQFTGKTQKCRYLMQLFTEHNTKIKALILVFQ